MYIHIPRRGSEQRRRWRLLSSRRAPQWHPRDATERAVTTAASVPRRALAPGIEISVTYIDITFSL